MDVVVVKFGGSVLSDEAMISKAAGMVHRLVQRGLGVVTVVSAMKGVTDDLMGLSRSVNPEAPPEVIDEVLAMGERTSARLFAAALMAKKLTPVVVDPDSELWPIITDEKHLDADPLYPETAERVRERVAPLVESGRIPVVCGFIGKSLGGRITTLGRGGSDTTALLLGSCLHAKEVLLVKDVDTVFSSDPDKVRNPIPLTQLNAEEAYTLTVGGAKFLHPKALGYKSSSVKLRIVSLEAAESPGTVIDGSSVELGVERTDRPITMITLIGETTSDPQSLSLLMNETKAKGGSIVSMTVNARSCILYVEGGENLTDHLHHVMVEKGIGKAMSAFEDLVLIAVKGRAMETIPGLIQRVTQPLARHNINIYGITTIASSIRVFVKKEDADRAVSLLKQALAVI